MKYLLFSVAFFGFSACSPERATGPVRSQIPAVESTELAQEDNALAILPKGRAATNACTALERLSEEFTEGHSFQYLAALQQKGAKWVGAVELSRSPFTQIFLGESFSSGSPEEFYKQAEKEHVAGKIGGMKWFVVRTMKSLGWLSFLQFYTINDKLDEAFPGIHGQARDLSGALGWSLANRAAGLDQVPAADITRILTMKLPLFSSGGWEKFATGTQGLLGSAITGLNQTQDAREKLCGFVLLQHHFAQLLKIKGYRAPEAAAADASHAYSWLGKLSKANPSFPTTAVNGAFTAEGKPTILESESITEYNPLTQHLGVAHAPPGTEGAEANGTLADALAMMEGLLHSFEATSPASPWVKERGAYWFGDVQTGSAILPAEAHSLSLGLLTLHFKNLAARHIRKINAAGSLQKEGEAAAGFVLDSAGLSTGKVLMRVQELNRLAEIVLQLDGSLRNFFNEPEAYWTNLNPVYDHQLLTALLGPEYFGEKASPSALAPEALRTSIRSLRLPLALLLIEMGGGEAGCVSAVAWNLADGTKQPAKRCDGEERTAIVATLKKMAARSGSSLVMERAKAIEAAGASATLR